MNSFGLSIVFFVLIAMAGCQSANKNTSEETEKNSNQAEYSENAKVRSGGDGIRITNPEAGSAVSSPVQIEGEAKGNWYFEAEFTVHLEQNGKTLADTIVHARGDWMTSDFVPFSTTIIFPENVRKGDAFLVFKNSNASGKPELDKTFKLPVRIK